MCDNICASGDNDTKVNVNFKEIRKKFENLSTNEQISNNEESVISKTPIPPFRKSKTNPNKFNSEKKVISVKERTKIFEGKEEVLCENNDSSTTCINVIEETKQAMRGKLRPKSAYLNYQENGNMACTPPTKPPRSFVHSNKNQVSNSNEAKHQLHNPSNLFSSKADASIITPKSKISSSFNSSSTKDQNTVPINRRFSNPQITSSNIDNKNATPKLQNISNKNQRFKNYFKTVSTTASNFREKVKQSRVFVDLTPTTVSPPKHYGTLKRSHSEEHIYAEPFENLKSQTGKSPNNNEETNKPLHYMCTPLVKPRLPERKIGGKVFSREHVRTMIYDSFAPLRTMPKENQDSKVPTSDSTEADMKAIQARIIYVKSIRQVSGSNICIAPKLYEALYIMNVNGCQPEISHSFPLKVPEVYRFPLLPHICFPISELFKITSNYQSETFYFNLHDKGEKIWGYCLRITGWMSKEPHHQPLCVKLPVAICLLSRFNAPLFYKRLLFEIEKHLILPREKCFKYIRSLQKLGIPNAGASVSIPDYTECSEENRVVVARPFDSHIVGFELTRALQLLDVDILVKAVSSLLLERRVLLLSSTVCNLYSSCQAIASLLYPFDWPHMFVPVLPACLTVHCCSELPYIIGICTKDYSSILELLTEHELLILDVDKGIVVKSCNDEDTILPRKVQKAVISALNLAKNMTDPTEMLRDIMISEAFVHMYVEMIGHYENHFSDQNGNLTFQKEGLLKNAISHSIQTFLEWFTETQMFDTFINESTWRINYRKICQTNLRTFFEKRIDEYKWELTHEGEKFSRFIEKTKNFGEKLISKLKK